MRPEDVELEPEVVDMLRRLPPAMALRVIDRLVARAAELADGTIDGAEARTVQSCEAGPPPPATETPAPEMAPTVSNGQLRRPTDAPKLVPPTARPSTQPSLSETFLKATPGIRFKESA